MTQVDFDQIAKLLKNSDAKDRGKMEIKQSWPTPEDKKRIVNAANGDSPQVILTDGRLYSVTRCKHKVTQSLMRDVGAPTRCVFVKLREGRIPCGHFLY